MMNLYLITYDLDYSQFLVNANNTSEALDLAVEQNLSEVFLGSYGDDESNELEIKNKTNYTIESVNDFEFLCEIIKREDWLGCTSNVMIFRGDF